MRSHFAISFAALVFLLCLACQGRRPFTGSYVPRSPEAQNRTFHFSYDSSCTIFRKTETNNVVFTEIQYETIPCKYQVSGGSLTLTDPQSGNLLWYGNLSDDRRSIGEDHYPINTYVYEEPVAAPSVNSPGPK